MIETGIYFGEIHSFNDLNLILSSVDIPAAVPKTNYIEISGGDGSIDLTEAHGDVKYFDRECKFTFTAPPMGASEWEELKTNVNNALNGKVFNITLDKDPDHYFSGRCSIDGYAENKKIRQIVVKARVKPWKFHKYETVITVTLTSNQTEQIALPNSKKTVSPEIQCSNSGVKLTYEGVTHTLAKGTNKKVIYIKEGTRYLTALGTGTIKFTYQRGEL